jgi:hypothetical protein
VCRLLVTADIVPSSLILVTLIMEAQGSSETSVLTRATRRSAQEDDILPSRCRENLKSDILLEFSQRYEFIRTHSLSLICSLLGLLKETSDYETWQRA